MMELHEKGTAQEASDSEADWLQSMVSKFRNLKREFITKVFELYYTSNTFYIAFL